MENKHIDPLRAGGSFLAMEMLVAALLFGIGRDLRWLGAWIIVGGGLVYIVIQLTLGLRYWPDLVHGRADTHFVHRWDRRALAFSIAGYVVFLVVCALDHRAGWSVAGAGGFWIGLAAYVIGYLVSFAAMAANPYAVGSARLQPDRGQVLVDTGPYRFIRHPMYAATIPSYLGEVLILGSWWALVVIPLMVAAQVYRCTKEDQMLDQGLPGYTDYRKRVRFRMIPGLW